MKAAIIRRRHLTDADYQPGGSGGVGPPIVQPPSTPGLTYNGLDFVFRNEDFPNGKLIPDFTRVGLNLYGGIPTITGAQTVTVSGFGKTEIDAAVGEALTYARANPGQYVIVYFPAGNYTYTGNLVISESRVVLRGAGKALTKITFSGGTQQNAVGGYIWFRGSLGTAKTNIAATSLRGSNQITLEPTNNITNGRFSAGKYARMQVGHYPAKFDKRYSLWKDPAGTALPVYVRELIEITAADAGSNTLTLGDRLRCDIDHTRTSSIIEVSKVIEWVGVEDLTIIGAPGQTTAHDGVAFEYVHKGWILDVDIVTPPYFPVNYYFARNIEVRGRQRKGCNFSNPQLDGGNFQGYHGVIAACECLWVKVYAENGRHLLAQGHSNGIVFHQVEGEGMDFHFVHTGSGHDALADVVTLTKASNTQGKASAKPWMCLLGPTPDNTILTPGGIRHFVWNCKFDGWKYGRGVQLGAFQNDGGMFYTTVISPQYHAAGRNGIVTVFDTTQDYDFYKNHFAARCEQAADSEALYRAKSTPVEILPGTVDQRTENGNVVYARQTGIRNYPPLTSEPGTQPTVPEVNSRSKTRWTKNTFFGITNPVNKEIKRLGGEVIETGTVYVDSSDVIPDTTVPDQFISMYLAQLAFRANNPSSFS